MPQPRAGGQLDGPVAMRGSSLCRPYCTHTPGGFWRGMLETNQTQPRYITFYRLADALECTLDDIKPDSAKRTSRHDRPRRPRNSRAVAGKKTRPFANMRDLRVIAIATGACEMPTCPRRVREKRDPAVIRVRSTAGCSSRGSHTPDERLSLTKRPKWEIPQLLLPSKIVPQPRGRTRHSTQGQSGVSVQAR